MSVCLTCGVSFCIDVVILNFVLLLVKVIFNENVDSVSISSCEQRTQININAFHTDKDLTRQSGANKQKLPNQHPSPQTIQLHLLHMSAPTFCESWLSILTSSRDLMVFCSSFSFIWVPSCSSL